MRSNGAAMVQRWRSDGTVIVWRLPSDCVALAQRWRADCAVIAQRLCGVSVHLLIDWIAWRLLTDGAVVVQFVQRLRRDGAVMVQRLWSNRGAIVW
jgi:hypothetical protein